MKSLCTLLLAGALALALASCSVVQAAWGAAYHKRGGFGRDHQSACAGGASDWQVPISITLYHREW